MVNDEMKETIVEGNIICHIYGKLSKRIYDKLFSGNCNLSMQFVDRIVEPYR